MLEELDAKLSELNILSPQSRQLFKEIATIKKLPKSKNIFVEGDGNAHEYLLLSGVLHRYNLADDGQLITTGFYMTKAVVTPHFARTKNGKSIFSLQALTNAVVAEIAVADLNLLRQTNNEFRFFGQKIIEEELSKLFYFETVYRSCSAKERLLILRNHFPNLENLVPHNSIASFLGITNVSFSRLRHELSVK